MACAPITPPSALAKVKSDSLSPPPLLVRPLELLMFLWIGYLKDDHYYCYCYAVAAKSMELPLNLFGLGPFSTY